MRRKSDTRFFTVEEATRTLPLVSRIIADIVEENDRLQELLPTLKEVRIRARRNPAAAEELESLRADVAVISTRLEGYLKELSQIGCVFKGPQGIVDFYSMREGRPVFLCWHHGEEEIRYWHELEGGFAGRLELEPTAMTSS
jgi:hypothetical protein